MYLSLHCYCPRCGSQGTLSAWLHGRLLDALHDNVLMALFLPLLAYWLSVNFRSGGKKSVPVFYNVFFASTVLLVVIFFWVLRDIPAYPFSILAPLN